MTSVRTVATGQLYLEYGEFKNPRTISGLSKDDLAGFAASIQANGVIVRPEVVRVKSDNADGFVNLVWDGQRRTLGAMKAFGPKHEIEVIDLDSEIYDLSDPKVVDMLEDRAMTVGNQRHGLSTFELVEFALRKRSRGKKQSEIAESIDRSESWVSKFLKAYDTATPVLIAKWRDGEITDEQFKELAAEKEQQSERAEELAELRKSGNRAEARAKTKEIAETAKQKKARAKEERLAKEAAEREAKAKAREQAKLDKAKRKHGGEQAKLQLEPPPTKAKDEAKPKPKKPAAPGKVALEEMVDLATKRPPTHDYVKGLLDGVRYALGHVDAEKFAKPWGAYMNRLAGIAAVPKSKQVTWKGGKAKARKPVKVAKAKGKKSSSGKRKR